MVDYTEDEGFTLADYAAMDNIVDILDKAEAQAIADRAREQYEVDEKSRQDWVEAYDKGMDMALQVKKAKTYPFAGCSNVIFPAITTASIQFAARAYPGIFPGRDIVKAKIIGDDSGQFRVNPETQEQIPVVPAGAKAARGKRVSQFMSWQLLEQIEDWEEETDQMLHNLPIGGTCFRKVSDANGMPNSQYLAGRDVTVNYGAKSLATAPQITECFDLWPHEIIERAEAGIYNYEAVESFLDRDSTESIEMLECHCRYDLDGDGVPENYIVTMAKEGMLPVRIMANYMPDNPTLRRVTYIKYGFIPNPDGGFYDIGFGWLLGPLNSEINTAINQLNDAAHWQNSKSGFIGKRLRLPAGNARFRPGEWKNVDSFGETLRNEMVPLDFGGPSPTTFQLLSLMISSAQDISSVKDIMMGETNSNLAPTTILTLVEQGAKQFVAIYKRVHRALKQELAAIYRIDAANADEIGPLYQEIVDDDEASPSDFAQDMNIVPVTDPDMVTHGAAMAKSQALLEMASQGLVDRNEATRRMLTAMNIEDPEALAIKQAPPDPEVMIKMAKLENDKARIAMAMDKTRAEILKMHTEAVENVANAEATEQGTQLERYTAQMAAMEKLLNELSAIQGVAGQPSNGGVLPAPGGVLPAPQAPNEGNSLGNGAGAPQQGQPPSVI